MLSSTKQIVRILLDLYEGHGYDHAQAEREINNPDIWDRVFETYFRSKPTDSRKITRPHRPGVTDPRWNILLHYNGGMNARILAVKILKRRERYPAQVGEAA